MGPSTGAPLQALVTGVPTASARSGGRSWMWDGGPYRCCGRGLECHSRSRWLASTPVRGLRRLRRDHSNGSVRGDSADGCGRHNPSTAPSRRSGKTAAAASCDGLSRVTGWMGRNSAAASAPWPPRPLWSPIHRHTVPSDTRSRLSLTPSHLPIGESTKWMHRYETTYDFL